MKLTNLTTIISREYFTRVKKRSFLLITFLGPIFFAAVAVLPSLIMFMTEDKGKTVAVVDQSGIVMDKFTDNETVSFEDYSSESVDSMKVRFADLGFDVLLSVSRLDSTGRNVTVAAY